MFIYKQKVQQETTCGAGITRKDTICPDIIKVLSSRRAQQSSPAYSQHTQQGNLRLCPNAKLAANSRKTHPEDVVTLGASPRYLQALRAPHDFALLRLFGCLWQLMIQQT